MGLLELLGIRKLTGRRLSYIEQGRSGYVRYQDEQTSFDMYWEFGGGDTLVWIDVPSKDRWTEKTKLPLEQRESILRFVAEQVIRDKTSTPHRYEIEEAAISIVKK